MTKEGGAKLQREDSDEWLCSSTYRPNRNEIVEQTTEKRKKKKTLKVVVFPRSTQLTPKLEKLNSVVGKNTELTMTPTRRPLISPLVSRIPSTQVMRQSPEQVIASLTPKRRCSLEIVGPPEKRRRAEEEEPESDDSEVSNLFENMPPLESSPQKSQYSLNFISGYEAQFTQFPEDIQEDSPDVFGDEEEEEDLQIQMSICEESSPQEAADLDGSPFKIEFSPEKSIKRELKEGVEKKVRKTLRFAEPEDWKKEHLIEESCAPAPMVNSTFREYAIDIETCGFHEEESMLHGDEERYTQAEKVPSKKSDSVNEDLLERNELTGLAARFASLMSGKSSERRLLMSDVAFGMVPREHFVKLNVTNCEKAFGLSILTSPCSLIISRSSSVRRLAPPPPPSPTPAAVVCGPAPSAVPASPFAPSSSPIPIVYYSIGALPPAPSTTICFGASDLGVHINPPLRRRDLMRLLIFCSLAVVLLQQSVSAIRCQCSTDKGGIPCYSGWCEVKSNGTHEGACALIRKGNSQILACARVSKFSTTSMCKEEIRGSEEVTKCWCMEEDYCNNDLVELIQVRKRSSEEEMTVEANDEYDENNAVLGKGDTITEKDIVVEERTDVVDMRKLEQPVRELTEEERNLPPWRRQNAINANSIWKPPPPPPMPGQKAEPTTSTSTTTSRISTTTITTVIPTTTTTAVSYEERMRQYEELRRQREMERERELRRRAELERQRIEEQRLRESQHDARRRFGEESRQWPPVVPATTSRFSSTTTTTTTVAPTTASSTTSTTTTTTAPPTTTSTTTIAPPTPKKETKTDYRNNMYRNWRRPFDLNPTQPISISSLSAIVYPPKNFVRASTTSTTTSTTTTTIPTTTTTTTTTEPPTTTTAPIIYPPANFRKATKGLMMTTEVARALPDDESEEDENENEDDEDEEEEEEVPQRVDNVMRRPEPEESEEDDGVILYTPPPTLPPPRRLPTPSVRTPSKKLDEYKKLVDSSALPSLLSTLLSSVVFLLLLS